MKALTVAELKAVATDKGYEVTKTKKADIIAEILAAQEVDTTGTLTAEDLALFTVAGIKAIAEDRGYDAIAATDKEDVITAFLAAQEAAETGETEETAETEETGT